MIEPKIVVETSRILKLVIPAIALYANPKTRLATVATIPANKPERIDLERSDCG